MNMNAKEIMNIETTLLRVEKQGEYELLDSGNEMKLERYGEVVLARPDPQALWNKSLSEAEWLKAAASFTRKGKEGVWSISSGTPAAWEISYGGLQFVIKPTSFKHTGLFPEQRTHWDWSRMLIQKAGRPITVLNLFGYTGGASLAAAQAGASVTHVDASKVAVQWAKENALRSGVADKPIRWIIDDVFAFVHREIKRKSYYDAIIMDPPAFGRGPKGELWKIEEGLTGLLSECEKLLSEKPLFMLVSGYAAGYSSLSFRNALEVALKNRPGQITQGEVALLGTDNRALSCGIYTRWIA